MKMFVAGVITTLVLMLVGAVVYVNSGAFDIAADSPHSDWEFNLIETTRDKAINKRATAVQVPADLNNVERVRHGAGNYDEMCADCHLKPGENDSEIRKGLYPVSPNLTKNDISAKLGAELAPKRQFWVIKHGIKASGMAAWAKGGMNDDDIWNLVAFLQKLPTLSANEYASLVKSSSGHSHGGAPVADHHDSGHQHNDAPPAKKTEPTKPRAHDGHDHKH